MVKTTGRTAMWLAAIGAMGFWCHCTKQSTRPATSQATLVRAESLDWDDDRPLDPLEEATEDWVDSWDWYITYLDSANIA